MDDQRTLSTAERIKAKAVAAAEAFANGLVEKFERDAAKNQWTQTFDATDMPRFPGAADVIRATLKRQGFEVEIYDGDQLNEPSIRLWIGI